MSNLFEGIGSLVQAQAPTASGPSTPAPSNPQSKFIQNAIKSGNFDNTHVVDYSLTSNKSKKSFIDNAYAYTFNTQYGPMTFIPETFVNQGANASNGKTYLSTWFTNKDNLNKFALDSTYVDLSGIGKIWGDQTLPSTRGFVVPGYNPPFSTKDLQNYPTSQIGGVSGLATKQDGSVVYKTGNNGFINVPTAGARPVGFDYIDTGFGSVPAPRMQEFNGTTSYYTPPPPEKSNNFFDQLGNNFGSVVKLAALVTGQPELLYFSAGMSAIEGDYLGAAMSFAGAYGNTPGVDPSTAATAKNVYNGLQVANAIKNNNPIAALTALSGMSGLGLPPEFTKATQLIAINNAIQKGDMASLAVAVGNIADNKDLAYAGKAANVVNAIQTGDIKKITNSLYGFLPELKEGYDKQSVSAIFDKMGYKLGPQESSLLDKGLSSSTDDLVKDAANNINKSAKDGGWDDYEQLIEAAQMGAKTKADYLAMKDGYDNAADKAAQGGYAKDDALAIKAGWDSAKQQQEASTIGANTRADYLAMKDGWSDEDQRAEAEKVGRYSPDEWKEYGIQDAVAKEAGWNSQADKEKASWYKVEDPNQYAEFLIARDRGFIDGDAEKNIADMKEAQSYGHDSYDAYKQAKDEAKAAGYPDLDSFVDAQKYDFLPNHPGQKYPSYSEYERAKNQGIEDIEDYLRLDAPTQAKAKNFNTVEDYIEANQHGVNKTNYYAIKSGETVWPDLDTYSKYTTASWENGRYVNPPGINGYKQDLVDQGVIPDTQTFDKFQGNIKAYQEGYKDNSEVLKAKNTGYDNPAEYRYAQWLYNNGILGKELKIGDTNYGRQFPKPDEFKQYASVWGWSDPEAFAMARQTNYYGSPQEWEANKAPYVDAFKLGFESPGDKNNAINIGATSADEYNKYKNSSFYKSVLYGDSYIEPKDAFAGYVQSNGDFNKFKKDYQEFLSDPSASEFPDYKTYSQFGGDADTYNLTNLVKGESGNAGTAPKFEPEPVPAPTPQQPVVPAPTPEQPQTPITPEQPPAVDDGTTDDIQDIIDIINPPTPEPEPTPVEPEPTLEQPAPEQPEPEVTDDGTTGGIQDVINDLPNLEGGDLGMTEEEWQNQFYEQIGIDPATLSDMPPMEQSEIDAILNQGPNVSPAQINRAKALVAAAKQPKPTPTPTPTPTTPPKPTTPPAQAPAQTAGQPAGLNGSNLLSLLALSDQPAQQQQIQPTPLADIKYYYDFNDDIGSNIFGGDMVPQKPQNIGTQPAMFSFFDGGEVDDLSADDLIGMLKGD